MGYSPENLQPNQVMAGSDIATANLLCAQDLPGGIHFDINQCLRIRDEWTERVRNETASENYRGAIQKLKRCYTAGSWPRSR